MIRLFHSQRLNDRCHIHLNTLEAVQLASMLLHMSAFLSYILGVKLCKKSVFYSVFFF